jgi:hypothetical protein
MLDQNDHEIASKTYDATSSQRKAHVTLRCEDTPAGEEDGFYMVNLEADYEPEMGDVTVVVEK